MSTYNTKKNIFKDGFVNNTTLANHVKAKHSNEKPYICEHCPARYATSMSLSSHRSRVHRVNKAGKYDLCTYVRIKKMVRKRSRIGHYFM